MRGILVGSKCRASSTLYSSPTPNRLIATTNSPLTAPPRSAICSALLRLERAEQEGEGRRERECHRRGLAGVRFAEERVQHVDEHAERDAQETDRAVLAPQECLGAFLDRIGDLPHLRGAVVLAKHVTSQTPGDGQGENGEPQDESNQHSGL